jgi:hypothetical protein
VCCSVAQSILSLWHGSFSGAVARFLLLLRLSVSSCLYELTIQLLGNTS